MTAIAAATIALLVTVALALFRSALGPTIFDRLQAASTIGTSVMLLLALFGFLAGRTEFLDLALVYGLLNLVGVLAVLKFFVHRNSSKATGKSQGEDA